MSKEWRKGRVVLRPRERYEICVEHRTVEGLQGFRWFATWEKPGQKHLAPEVIRLVSAEAGSLDSRLRFLTASNQDIGFYRIVYEENKWYLELLEEVSSE